MKKILITGSLLPLIEMGGNFLSRENIKIFSVLSDTGIVNLHRAENVDLIIKELNASGTNVDETCTMIRDADTMNNVPIILICNKDKADIVKCHASRANAYITQPVEVDELLRNIRKFLISTERIDSRVLLHVLIKGESEDHNFFANSMDISDSGICFESDRDFTLGARIKGSFFLESNQIEVNGKIVRVGKKTPDLHYYGVQFMNLEPTAKKIIMAFLEKSAKH